jgi:hypothetical protein
MNTKLRLFQIMIICMAAVVCHPVTAQFSPDGQLLDDDGILSIEENPFDVNKFLIGRDFHENKFKDQDKGLKGMADCFFNISDASDYKKQNFRLCRKLGLGVIVSAEGKHKTGGDWMKMSDGEIDEYVRKMVEGAGKRKEIIGYHICDEPSSLAFPKLAVAVAAVRKYAPGKMATINLYPNYATLWTLDQIKSQLGTRTYEEYLEDFVRIVKPDMISYDNYMVQFSMDQQEKSRAAQYYTNIMSVRKISLESQIPWWNVVSGNQIRFFTTIPTSANLLLQAYSSLAAGAGGVRWFTYWQGGYNYTPVNALEQKTFTWHYLREVNRQMSVIGPIVRKLKSTGVYFTDPAMDSSLPLLPGEHVLGVESEQPLMIGEMLSEKGNRYIMVVNLSLEKSARFVLNTKIGNERLFVVSPTEEKPFFMEILSHNSRNSSIKPKTEEQEKLAGQKAYWLPAGQGVLIRCSGVADK